MEAEAEPKTIAGVPQLIYKMPLDATVGPQVEGLEVAGIFDRLISGRRSIPGRCSKPLPQR